MHAGFVLLALAIAAPAAFGEDADAAAAAAAAPKFNDVYTVKGTLYIPYAEIREPFYAWYDAKARNSRIDYYGGMVKTYQLGKYAKYGSSIKIAPVTTETQLNEDTCLQVNGTNEMMIEPQGIVPDLTGFENVGSEVMSGQTCEKWRLVDTKGDKVNKYTIWVRYKKGRGGKKVPIPVRYEMKGFNSLLGSHFDHYFLEYDWFSVDPIDADVFQVPRDMKCESFPGPGADHVVTFNPMQEFIHGDDRHVTAAFDEFLRTHKKHYSRDTEHSKRHGVFLQNLRFIHSTNRANKGYRLAVNHLADRTPLELRALRGKQRSTTTYNGGLPFPYDAKLAVADVPSEFDWRLYGAVTPVKDQSVCGSCWSFGTTGAIEGAYFVKYGKLLRLSQQALVDCSWGYGNNGCDGGEDFRSYQWMMKHGGLPTEDAYGPYYGQDGYCHIDNVTMSAPIKGYVNVTSGDADALKVAVVRHGPISVAIDASHRTFSFYANGVYYDPKCGNTTDTLDHAVLVVGYGSLYGKPYWLVKNSWSNYWGNDGYVLISQENNNCGVTLDPTYVVM